MSMKRRLNFPLIQAYKRVFGNIHVAPHFVIPKSPEWPQEFHGYNFGKYIDKIRMRRKDGWKFYENEDLLKIDQMGLDWDNVSKESKKVSLDNLYDDVPDKVKSIFQALVTFNKLETHMIVPPDFVIAHGDKNYPIPLWGMPLGRIFQNILNDGFLIEYREKLGLIKFPFNHACFDIIHIALETYKELHGNLQVHRKYVIEFSDERYPEVTRGIKLGKVVQRIRQNKVHNEHREELLALGFVFDDDGNGGDGDGYYYNYDNDSTSSAASSPTMLDYDDIVDGNDGTAHSTRDFDHSDRDNDDDYDVMRDERRGRYTESYRVVSSAEGKAHQQKKEMETAKNGREDSEDWAK